MKTGKNKAMRRVRVSSTARRRTSSRRGAVVGTTGRKRFSVLGFLVVDCVLPMLFAVAAVALIAERRGLLSGARHRTAETSWHAGTGPNGSMPERDGPASAVPAGTEDDEGGNLIASEVEEDEIADEESSDEEELPTHDHLRPPLLRPASRRVIFQAGRLDGFPRHRYSPLARHEFDLLEDREREVFQVHGDDERTRGLPQRLLPGQEVVVYLPEYARRDLVLRARLIERRVRGALELRFNDRTIWRRAVPTRDLLLRALIPEVWLEDFENSLTVRNNGESTLIFDALWIEEAAPLREKLDFEVCGLERLPPKVRPFLMRRGKGGASVEELPNASAGLHHFPARRLRRGLDADQPLAETGGARWYVPTHRLGVAQAELYMRELLGEAVGYYENGGGRLALENLSEPGVLFSPLTGLPYPPAAGIWQLAMLVLGERRRLHVNATRGDSEEGVLNLSAVGVEHSANSASIMVAKRYGGGRLGRCVLRMSAPWHGPTDVQIIREVVPESFDVPIPPNRRGGGGEYDRTMAVERRTVDIPANGAERGLFEMEAEFKEAVFLRLRRKGEAFPVVASAKTDSGPSPELERGAVRVVNAPVGQFALLKTHPPFNAVLSPLCSCYSVDIREATRGQVGDAQHVTPLHEESFFLTADSACNATAVGEGALIGTEYFGLHKDSYSLSFWVYPHVDAAEDAAERSVWDGNSVRPGLKIIFGSLAYDAALTAGRWQRVECRLPNWDEMGVRPSSGLLFAESGTQAAGSDDPSITYEFNGLGVLSRPEGAVHSLRLPPDKESDGRDGIIDLVLLGPPAKRSAYWHQFKVDATVESVTCIGGDERRRKPRHAYFASSQRLHVAGLRFPPYPSPEIVQMLKRVPQAGRTLMENEGLTPIFLRIRMRR